MPNFKSFSTKALNRIVDQFPDHAREVDLPDFCGERLAHFPDLSLEGDGALEAER
jgi:hypothetical protein